jgi:hypothetical protein
MKMELTNHMQEMHAVLLTGIILRGCLNG